MIYAGNIYNFSELAEALKNYGVDSETINIGMEYIDVSKPRNNELLKKIKTKDFGVQRDNTSFHTLFHAVADNIKKHRDDELYKRYVLFCYAAAGCKCWEIMAPMTRFGDESDDKKIKEAFLEFSDDESRKEFTADSMMRAMDANMNKNRLRKFEPEICLQAAVIASANAPDTTLFLALNALDSLEVDWENKVWTLGEKLREKIFGSPKQAESVIAQGCIKLMKPIIFNSGINISDGDRKVYLAEMAYFDNECREKFREEMKKFPELLLSYASDINLNMKKMYELVVSEKVEITKEYVSCAMDVARGNDYAVMLPHLKYLAEKYEDFFVYAMEKKENAVKAKNMLGILLEVNPDYKEKNGGIKEIARKRLINTVHVKSGGNLEILAYLHGKKTLPEIINTIQNTYISYGSNDVTRFYYLAYGMDETVKRCVTITALCAKYDWSTKYNIFNITGFDYEKSDKANKEFADILLEENAPIEKVLTFEIKPDNLVDYADKIAEIDLKLLTAEARCQYLKVFDKAGAEKYRDQIFAAADDTSKAVRAVLKEIVPKIPDCREELENMLAAKKAAKRETALEIIANMKDIDWTDSLTSALEKEKSEKLRVKITSLLGVEQSGEDQTERSLSQLAEELTKGSKTRKLAWLYQSEYMPVHFKEGSEAAEKYMQAILLCYAGGDYKNGRQLGDALDQKELAVFAAEVMGRWLDSGAAAKDKWILIFTAVWGGTDIISTFVYYIKFWSDNMRGAMAVAAVKALALNGSSEALMQVDSFARKYKSNQVKAAANEALAEAAEFLGITVEELADKIVPDMGFDEKMCRTFDYGNRQFSVYLTPSLEIEIYNGEKKIKNMPKPGVNDTAEIAEKSYAEFKEMKKQLKTAVSVQKARLEYTLMCDRKWTSDNWKKLFVKNPVMHCFAIGLIWGVYEDNALVSTFRYMDDGSFTTSDEDEFELPENAKISLVHPVELSEEEISAWTEQLEDYEIVQPFPQLSRAVYRAEEKELNEKKILRFCNKTAVNLTLLGRMTKNGWFKGVAQDAGYFYEFTRNDISRRVKDSQGRSVPEGCGAELKFSGMYIGAYGMGETEDVSIEELSFFDSADKSESPLTVKDVNKRYFSEIIMQLTEIIGE